MSQAILPQKPGTRRLPKSVEEKIGRRNGRQETGPRYYPRILTDTEREAQGYVKCVAGGGTYWEKKERASDVELYGPVGDAARAQLKARIAEMDAADKARREAADKSDRVARLRRMAAEMEANSRDRCAFCRAPDGQCSH